MVAVLTFLWKLLAFVVVPLKFVMACAERNPVHGWRMARGRGAVVASPDLRAVDARSASIYAGIVPVYVQLFMDAAL